MKHTTILLAFVIAAGLSSCGNPYKYLGKSYAPTSNPEIFFRDADVPADFEQMGKLEVELPDSKNMDKIQSKVMDIAAKKGADAVMIDNFDMTTGGFTTVESGARKKNKKDGGGDVSYGATAGKTKVNKNVLVKATLLKFKENIPSRQ